MDKLKKYVVRETAHKFPTRCIYFPEKIVRGALYRQWYIDENCVAYTPEGVQRPDDAVGVELASMKQGGLWSLTNRQIPLFRAVGWNRGDTVTYRTTENGTIYVRREPGE